MSVSLKVAQEFLKGQPVHGGSYCSCDGCAQRPNEDEERDPDGPFDPINVDPNKKEYDDEC